jgi:hypothetical protein
MSPAETLRQILTLIEGAADIANERQQRLLLQCILELAHKGLERPPVIPLLDAEHTSGPKP